MEDIILDCDPGHDDAIALILAIYSAKINLLGVTTSAGNQKHSQTLRNAMSLLTLMHQQSIPIASGNRTPLFRDLISGISVHGVTGLDGTDLPTPNFPSQSIPATELMAKIITKNPNKVTIVVTGPCTNLALFLAVHPELKGSIKRLIIFGGGMGVGNCDPTTEFNFKADPEAAKIVINAGIPLVLAPLNVGLEAQLFTEDRHAIHRIKNPVAQAVAGLTDFYGLSFDSHWNLEGLPLYDPCTIAWLIDPSQFSSKNCHVTVETKGELTAGESIIDYYQITHQKPNAEVLFHVNRDWFAKLIIDAVKSFSQK
ncbi:nucleoside hydrolase [Loigolactobacillus bifermentans]|uniref:Inosine-uridine nucleoside n-ribohydrolase n=1 Tax=Loigolactobacillus bifermentans DSM 20003 TaxID=1423726 RepID=A0A0R1HAM0_9LACO|nr:nucleoside hydrolase [Loigolactobacillus bifermentans]KRK41025.1 inosine-uridine nucleoside n-ribohydrolase [Loigolactobacillus bifermentans DSM 20003]QGG59892.1 pyrimidine-specific ribonucleoside hydrolase RihA [Loigolactobacillus bifermentans]